jgi:formate dehydrogenase subunit delta
MPSSQHEHDQAGKLVMMANQIAKNVAIQGEEKAVKAIANHIQKFWEPRMRKAIIEHASKGGEGLDPVALRAVQKL